MHDCFNWLCVLIFLPLEAAFHPLQRISVALTGGKWNDHQYPLHQNLLSSFAAFDRSLCNLHKKLIVKLKSEHMVFKSSQGNAVSAFVDSWTIGLECIPVGHHQSSSFQRQVSAMMTQCLNLISLKS